jgi:hypothetical protein
MHGDSKSILFALYRNIVFLWFCAFLQLIFILNERSFYSLLNSIED